MRIPAAGLPPAVSSTCVVSLPMAEEGFGGARSFHASGSASSGPSFLTDMRDVQYIVRIDQYFLHMELRHLRYFATLAQELSFTRAAQRLNVSQPPLSQQIRALEIELGTLLFLRTSRRVELTAAGHVFLAHAKAILERADQACAQTRAVGAGHAGHLEIGLSGSLLLGPVPQLIASYRRGLPGVRVVLHEMTPAAQLAALRDRRIDISFSRTAVNDDFLVSELAWEDPVLVALPRGH